MGESAYSDVHQSCGCCAANDCHQSTKCHNTPSVCICSHQIPQAFLRKNKTFPTLGFTGYLAQNSNIAYLYLSVIDIFHPPRA